jgi:hypothetical protein
MILDKANQIIEYLYHHENLNKILTINIINPENYNIFRIILFSQP